MSLAGMVRKITPISRSKPKIDEEADEMNVEYSIALVYNGPLVELSIPRAVPLDFAQIPTAKAAEIAVSGFADLTVPVVHPISRRGEKESRNLDVRVSDVFLVGGGEGTESSGTLGFSDSRDHSHELSGSSDMGGPETPVRSLAQAAFSVEVSDDEEEIEEEEGLRRKARRGNVNVRFVDPDTCETVDREGEEYDYGDSAYSVEEVVRARREVTERVAKKGVCFRCLKGNRLTEKEVCIVCDAKYCCGCVLRAMGSMPEGRKCITCIGYPIEESKRKSLGRCSRMLRRLLSEDGVKLIMREEETCIVNQIPPELITVNGNPLSEEELIVLLNCPVPPRKLKPGRYWYDKVSGYWGKEGHMPCQIITPDLSVMERVKRNASNGNTNLTINGREITKKELWMLKSAGVQCTGISALWLDPDGSYMEEGMGNVKQSIWGKKRTKVLCTLLSLPTPESPRSNVYMPNVGEGTGFNDLRSLHKLLLLSNNHSGTSTIYKQARAAYNVQFSEEEREKMKFMIQSKMYGYLAVLLEGREVFEEECLAEMRRQAAERPGPSDYIHKELDKTVYSISHGSRLRASSDWLVNIMVSGNLDTMFPAATREYAPLVEELWNDPAIQATYSRVDELGLPRAANYILSKAVEIAKVDYEPSELDILCTEGINSSNGLAHMEFSFPVAADEDGSTDYGEQRNSVTRYQLIRAHTNSLGKNCKWLEMFEDVSVVLFCVSLSDYDEYEVDGNGSLVNKMMANKKLFESIIDHPTFSDTIFLLILNKFDLLEEKIEQAPLTQCEWFSDFNPVLSRHQNGRNSSNNTPPLAQRAFHYMAVKFKRLFQSIRGRNLYVCRTTALEQHTVDEAMKYVKEIIRWEEEKVCLSLTHNLNEISSDSIEASTS